MKKYYLIFAMALIMATNCFSQIEGKYKGAIIISPAQSIEIYTDFFLDSGKLKGTIDIPEQGVKAFPLTDITHSGDSILFTMKNPSADLFFKGIYITNDSVSGEFTQSTFKLNFFVSRFIDTEPLPPYKVENVSFENGNNHFAGTLTLPPYPGKHPAVVLITGSGPQDRDENIYGFKIFKIIADHLTKNGIAVLRYDDRNVGESKGMPIDSSTSADFATDVLEAVKYLRTRDDINPNEIGLLGHSEGGIIAPMVAVKDPKIAFIVLMAGPSVPGKDVILKQTEMILRINGADDNEINESLKFSRMLIDITLNNGDFESIIPELESYSAKNYSKLPEESKKNIDSLKFIKDSPKSYIQAFSSIWMKYFLTYDPQVSLLNVKCPTLALFGEKDLQVPVVQNLKPMEDYLKASGNKLYTVKVFDSANHLFQEATNGSPSEYQSLKKEFVPGFLEYITSWILGFVTPSR